MEQVIETDDCLIQTVLAIFSGQSSGRTESSKQYSTGLFWFSLSASLRFVMRQQIAPHVVLGCDIQSPSPNSLSSIWSISAAL